MKSLFCIAAAALVILCACNTEPTDAAKANGAVNTATPGNFTPEAATDATASHTTTSMETHDHSDAAHEH